MAEDFAKAVRDLKGYEQDFCLSPDRWRRFQTTTPLNWRRIKFNIANRGRIPSIRGIYAFIVEPEATGFPPHGYLMYVGIAGGRFSSNTLRARYADYLDESKTLKRAKIHFMLTNWPDNLQFYYVPIPDTRRRLETLEAALNDALLPPYNTNDFSAEIRPKVRAMR